MNRTVRVCVCAGLFAGVATGASNIAQAAPVPVLTKAYLFSNWSGPTTGSSPAFSFQGATGVELLLSGASVTGIRNTGPIELEIDRALTYAAHTNTIDAREPGRTAARVNSEVGTWDDAGIVNEGRGDANLNIDYKRSRRGGLAEVVFNPISGRGEIGYNALIIAEDAAFDPLGLSICSDAACVGRQTIISDFTPAAITSILARSDFVANDNSNAREMDQVFLFLFSDPVQGFAAIADIGNAGGERLELDFVGTGNTVPIPGAAWLFGTAIAGLGALARRKGSAKS